MSSKEGDSTHISSGNSTSGPTTFNSTEWLSLKVINYKNEGDDTLRSWEYVTRTTKQPNVADAVIIVPILKSSKSRKSFISSSTQANNGTIDTLLVEQYRPPLSTYTLEFPAGLIDQGETPKQAALRELWEETGYIGTVNSSGTNSINSTLELCMSPGITDETVYMIVVDVDLDDPRNDNPIQHLEDGENVVVRRVPLTTGLREYLDKENSKSSGSNGNTDRYCMPISMLYSFALGLEMGAQLSNTTNKNEATGSDDTTNGDGVVIEPNRQSMKLQQQYRQYQSKGRMASKDGEESSEC